jgi:hypothetical protein
MRRWVCIIALLAGFSGDGYAWTIRPRIPTPIERPIEARPGPGLRATADWWRPSADWWQRLTPTGGG